MNLRWVASGERLSQRVSMRIYDPVSIPRCRYQTAVRPKGQHDVRGKVDLLSLWGSSVNKTRFSERVFFLDSLGQANVIGVSVQIYI